MEHDRRGRKRQPNQERGLRPLHPLLPSHWISKPVRVAMSREDWERFEEMVASVMSQTQSPTQARAQGMVVSRLMDTAEASPPRSARSTR